MKNQKRIMLLAIIANSLPSLLLYLSFELVEVIFDNTIGSKLNYNIERFTSKARSHYYLPTVSLTKCTKYDHIYHLFRIFGVVIFKKALQKVFDFIVQFFSRKFHYTFLTRSRSDCLALMLASYFNQPIQQSAEQQNLNLYFESANDFSRFFLSIIGDIIVPITKVISSFMQIKFEKLFIYPLLPLPIVMFLGGVFAKSSKLEQVSLRRDRSITTKFIQDLQDRLLLVKSSNSAYFEIQQLKKQLEQQKQQLMNQDSARRKRKTLDSFIGVYKRAIVGLLQIYFLVFNKFTLKQCKDFKDCIDHIYKLKDDIVNFVGKLQSYSISLDFVETVLSYSGERVVFKSVSQTLNYLNIEQAKKLRTKYQKTPVLETKNVDFEYQQNKIFNNLNIKFKRGFNLIQGETGCGKSTFLKLITKLYSIQSGSILINGQSITDMDTYDIRYQITSVHQSDQLPKHLSLDQQIMYGLYPDNDRLERVKKICRVTFEGKEVNKLSGGQKQRLALARGLFRVVDCGILLLDEVTSALDIETEGIVLTGLKEFCQEHQILVIMVAHREQCQLYADRIVDLKDYQ